MTSQSVFKINNMCLHHITYIESVMKMFKWIKKKWNKKDCVKFEENESENDKNE